LLLSHVRISGLLTVSSRSYLISISGRLQVAQIWGKPIYVITEVAFIPLSSQSDADDAIAQTKSSPNKHSEDDNAGFSDTSDDEDHDPTDHHDNVFDDDNPTRPNTPDRPLAWKPGTPRSAQKSSTSVAEDVFEKKGQYGRFADRWFSKKGWSIEKRRMQGMSTAERSESLYEPGTDDGSGGSKAAPDAGPSGRGGEGDTSLRQGQKPVDASSSPAGDVVGSLLPKLVKTTKMMLGSRSFYFSYDSDITRRVGDRDVRFSDMPLHERIDPLVSHVRIDLGKSYLAYVE